MTSVLDRRTFLRTLAAATALPLAGWHASTSAAQEVGSRKRVVVLGATNRSDVLDPALLRPGRFDRRVIVQPPDRQGRAEILAIHTRGVPLAPDVNLDSIAANMPGATGAELRNLVNEASLTAARRGNTQVTMRDFSDAMEKLFLGAERRILRLDNPGVPERTAGHTISIAVQYLLPAEVAPAHRHTPNAIRFMLHGEGAYTTIEGDKFVMRRGDLVVTPSMTWHDHGNEGSGPVIWTDALDSPVVRYLENLAAILRIQDHILELADQHGVPIVDNVRFDDSVLSILRHVTETLRKQGGFGEA